MTAIYLATAAYINMALRPFGLILMATFSGDPPEKPYRVTRIVIQRRGKIGMWR